MFTGIIEKTARVRSIEKNSFWFDISFVDELKISQSVACDGVCLTVVETDRRGFRVDVLEETKRLTRFSSIREGDLVNIERAMRADDRLDGHIVQAHSEGVGLIKKIVQEKVMDRLITVQIPSELMQYVIVKGIIILNGIALTVTSLDDERSVIQVVIIPHTWEYTNMHVLSVGDEVNVETDVLAKYVERLQVRNASSTGIISHESQ